MARRSVPTVARCRSGSWTRPPGLHDIAGGPLGDTRTVHNRLHSVVGLLRQSGFGRSTGYDDVNDADRPALDPVMRQVVGGRGVDAEAASAGRMGRFDTGVSAAADNRGAPADVSGQWIDRGIDRAHAAMTPEWITPDMDGSVGPPHGAQTHPIRIGARVVRHTPEPSRSNQPGRLSAALCSPASLRPSNGSVRQRYRPAVPA